MSDVSNTGGAEGAEPEIQEEVSTGVDDGEIENGEGGENEADGGEEGSEGQEGQVASGGATPSRGETRQQKLANELNKAREREAALQARLTQILTTQQQAPAHDVAAQQAEAQRVAAMDPLERQAYEADKRVKALEAQVANLGFAQQDGLDRARFEAKAAVVPLYAKYMPQVEKTLQEMRATGVNTTREAILDYLYGKAQRLKAEQALKDGTNKKVSAAAAGRVASVNGRPANLRGDASGVGGGKSLEDKLRGVPL